MPGAQLPCPTEDQECITFFDWCKRVRYRGEPLSERVVHIPNERDRHAQAANRRATGQHIIRLQRMGVQPGFYDYVVLAPVIRPDGSIVGGLYLEAKRRRGGRVTPEQHAWGPRYERFGYEAQICCGSDALIAATQSYFERYAHADEWVNRVRLR